MAVNDFFCINEHLGVDDFKKVIRKLLPENFFLNFAWKNRNFYRKNWEFFTGIYDPQISNQIDAAGRMG